MSAASEKISGREKAGYIESLYRCLLNTSNVCSIYQSEIKKVANTVYLMKFSEKIEINLTVGLPSRNCFNEIILDRKELVTDRTGLEARIECIIRNDREESYRNALAEAEIMEGLSWTCPCEIGIRVFGLSSEYETYGLIVGYTIIPVSLMETGEFHDLSSSKLKDIAHGAEYLRENWVMPKWIHRIIIGPFHYSPSQPDDSFLEVCEEELQNIGKEDEEMLSSLSRVDPNKL